MQFNFVLFTIFTAKIIAAGENIGGQCKGYIYVFCRFRKSANKMPKVIIKYCLRKKGVAKKVIKII